LIASKILKDSTKSLVKKFKDSPEGKIL